MDLGLRLHRDFASAMAAMTRVGRVFEPVAGHQDVYGRLYAQVCQRMYRRLQPLDREIAQITGYPAS